MKRENKGTAGGISLYVMYTTKYFLSPSMKEEETCAEVTG